MGQVKNFRELYCEHQRLPPEKFERTLVWRCLHWQARPFYWLLSLNRDFFSADFDFVRGVGELRSRRQFRDEAAEFHYHPNNRGLLRTFFRLRVSSHRLQAVFESEIKRATTTSPF
jgi:hypothetical protein